MLEVKNLLFSYIPGKKVVDSISFKVERGEMLALIGESGSGKSTILKLIYGLIQWNEGEILFENKLIERPDNKLVLGEPSFKYLAQDFDLMPYITVKENVGKYVSNTNKLEKTNKVLGLLELVGMLDYADVKAKDLSGGQKQRVALARSLAETPSVLILDEPFSHIDTFKKSYLKRGIFEYAKENKITVILATHEINDVLSYADKVLVIREGQIIQEGLPEEIYNFPKTDYVANLFGESNFLPIHSTSIPENKTNVIVVYPDQFRVEKEGDIQVSIIKNYYLGSHYLIESLFNDIKIFFYHPLMLKPSNYYSLKITSYCVLENF